jgi:hypothetical protein
MDNYSETTRDVFNRSIALLEGKISDDKVTSLRQLLDAGELTDVNKIERILRAEEP